MARGQRKSIDEKIESTLNQIAATEKKLKTLKQELAELEAEKRSVELNELYDFINQNGFTIDDIREFVQNTISQSA